MKNTVDILNCLSRQRGSVFITHCIVEPLNHMRLQSVQSNSTQSRFDMYVDMIVVILDCQWFYTAKILRFPGVQPFTKSHFTWSGICTGGDRGGCRLELLTDFLLRFTRDGTLNLFPGSGVKANGVAGFPECVFLSVPCNCLFANGADSCGAFSCVASRHDKILLSPHSRYG